MPTKNNGPTILYRHFAGDGTLLYVGITSTFITREQAHRSKSWAGKIAKITLERFKTRDDASHAEAQAIEFEKPLHNRTKPNGIRLGGAGNSRLRSPITRLKLLNALGSNRNIGSLLGISTQAVGKWALDSPIPHDREEQLRKLRPELFA